MLETVLLPLVVVPAIGITGMMLPRSSVNPLQVGFPLAVPVTPFVILLQLVPPLLQPKAVPTFTVVTYGTIDI